MNRKGVKEFVCYNEGCGIIICFFSQLRSSMGKVTITFGYKFHVFAPDYLQAFTKLTRTLESNLDLLKCILVAEELSLGLAEMRTCLDEVHGVQGFGKRLKIGNSLCFVRHSPGSRIIQIPTRNKSFISVPLPGPVSMILTPVFVLP